MNRREVMKQGIKGLAYGAGTLVAAKALLGRPDDLERPKFICEPYPDEPCPPSTLPPPNYQVLGAWAGTFGGAAEQHYGALIANHGQLLQRIVGGYSMTAADISAFGTVLTAESKYISGSLSGNLAAHHAVNASYNIPPAVPGVTFVNPPFAKPILGTSVTVPTYIASQFGVSLPAAYLGAKCHDPSFGTARPSAGLSTLAAGTMASGMAIAGSAFSSARQLDACKVAMDIGTALIATGAISIAAGIIAGFSGIATALAPMLIVGGFGVFMLGAIVVTGAQRVGCA